MVKAGTNIEHISHLLPRLFMCWDRTYVLNLERMVYYPSDMKVTQKSKCIMSTIHNATVKYVKGLMFFFK